MATMAGGGQGLNTFTLVPFKFYIPGTFAYHSQGKLSRLHFLSQKNVLYIYIDAKWQILHSQCLVCHCVPH